MYEVFFSHAEEDWNFVERVSNILDRIGISCYTYERYPEYGEYIPEIIKQRIDNYMTVIVLLTQNSVQSQWVNQEIGMAFALDRNLIPIVENGIETKGFVELRQRINYDENSPDDAIYALIYRLRILHPKDNIELYCENEKCENHTRRFNVSLPTQEEINDAIGRNLLFVADCPSCGRQNNYYPETLEQEGIDG